MDYSLVAGISEQDARKIVLALVEQQEQAIRERNFADWSEKVYTTDSIALQLQQSWFEGYFVRLTPTHLQITVERVELQAQNIRATICIEAHYEEYDPLREQHVYTLAHILERKDWCIVWVAKIAPPFPGNLIFCGRSLSLPEPVHLSHPSGSWYDTELLVQARFADDPLDACEYAQAITRTVRAREKYPEIECAACLADMMSQRVAQMLSCVAAEDPQQLLANLYYFGQHSIEVRMIRSDRNNSWQSKLHVPWFGFDEILAQREQKDRLVGSCPSIMTFYLAVLRLGGIGPQDVWQVRLHNHDVLFIRLAQQFFLFAPDKICYLTATNIYYTLQTYKIFNDTWYSTRFGHTNGDPLVLRSLTDFFHEERSRFRFLPSTVHPAKDSLPEYAAYVASRASSDPERISRAIKKHVLDLSAHYPHSPFTWAKYASQTLLVSKPETYACWALQNPLVRSHLQSYTTFSALRTDLHSFGRDSIFAESDRLMTVEQVFRYRTGDCRAFALLLFTYLKLMTKQQCYLFFTENQAYCLEDRQGAWRFWDAETLDESKPPTQQPLLIFDEQASYYPLLRRENEKLLPDRIVLLLQGIP